MELSDVLEIVSPASAVSQDRQHDHYEQRDEHDDDRDLNEREQKSYQRDQLLQECDD